MEDRSDAKPRETPAEPPPGIAPQPGARPEVTVILPNFRTPEITTICLRLLRRHTDPRRIRVIVVDNASGDASVEYLRQVEWIRLIEREVPEGEPGYIMHAKALDLAFAEVDTPYVMIMHTDTLILDDGWLDYLLGEIRRDDSIAGVGSWKLEEPPSPIGRFFKSAETLVRKLLRRRQKNDRYLRSHCALYRTDLLRRHTAGFFDGKSAGRSLHHKLIAAGYRMIFLDSEILGRYLCHLNHATMILNPRDGDRKTARRATRRKLSEQIRRAEFLDILNHPELDRY